MSENAFPKMPELRVSKNGYEIRADILQLAKEYLGQDFHYKYVGWETSVVKDPKTGQIVTSVAMPEFPGLDKVLETASRMYEFVNQTTPKK